MGDGVSATAGYAHAMGLRDRLHVLIAGGGVAALETLLALRALAGDLIDVTLLSPTTEFVYRPVTVAEAFDRAEARVYDLAEVLADQGGRELVDDSLADVEARSRVAVTGRGRRISYDVLVVATGAVPRAPFPGAFTFRGREDVPVLRGLLHDLTTGRAESVALALPSPRMWPLPLYELALMTASHVSEHAAGDVRVTLVTPEEEPLELFGPTATEAVRALLTARGIAVRSSSLPAMMRGRTLLLAGGSEMFADRVITLPLPEGPGCPGFRTTSTASFPSTSSAGSATSTTSTPPATSRLSRSSREALPRSRPMPWPRRSLQPPVPPSHPSRSAAVLRGLLLTGGAPLYLRAEPHRLTARGDGGDRSSPGRIDPRARPRPRPGRHVVARGEDRRSLPAPYLATARSSLMRGGVLADRTPVPGAPVSDEEQQERLRSRCCSRTVTRAGATTRRP